MVPRQMLWKWIRLARSPTCAFSQSQDFDDKIGNEVQDKERTTKVCLLHLNDWLSIFVMLCIQLDVDGSLDWYDCNDMNS